MIEVLEIFADAADRSRLLAPGADGVHRQSLWLSPETWSAIRTDRHQECVRDYKARQRGTEHYREKVREYNRRYREKNPDRKKASERKAREEVRAIRAGRLVLPSPPAAGAKA